MNDIDCEIQNVTDGIGIDENSSEYSWVFELTPIIEHAATTKNIKDLFRTSFENFDAGIHAFENINDILRIALLHSNLYLLMRYYPQYYVLLLDGIRQAFSQQERQSYLNV
ncbi:unnamed protein product [Rotaria sp. Silwood1]|nr:unnamed protein product [Rotaria sp. Silwood1]CAF3842047.1 unnamed protein product [Rotaria sp. Silwood1]CAF3862042.1 unnamed protein product [Rotaria sp. Silwood1]CAF3929017.1 unnamed protein product [Rotaria sp. Silwood1]CAF4834746.1 unnamed protein product [Rotaria sp. Silwood1]